MRIASISSGLLCACLLMPYAAADGGAASAGTSDSAVSSTAPADHAAENTAARRSPREVVERAIEPVLATLSDRSTTRRERAESISATVRAHMDYRVLSRAMLGATWETLDPAEQAAFIDAFSEHLTGVYLPLMDRYSGEVVEVTEDAPVGRADHMVMVSIRDNEGEVQRQIATLACRLREVDAQWRIVDLTVEGISIARIFGAQFRPVLAQDGVKGLVERLRRKSAENDAAVGKS